MNPDSDRLTDSTIEACDSMAVFLWMTPSPPARAMAMAISDSVTLSIAADMIGVRSMMPGTSWVSMLRSRGRTEEGPGSSSTSS